MLIFLLILFIILASVELYVRGRISFIISKPFVPFSRVSTRRAKRISFFLDLISVVAVSIFTFADARTSCSSRFLLEFYMKYSVYDSLFFKYPFNVWRVVCGCLFSLFCSDGLAWLGLAWLGFLHARSILIFALSLILGTCAFCGFLGFVAPSLPFPSDLQ